MWTLTEIPIVQAPMAGAQGPKLCIAVCEAGGLGSIPCAMLTADVLRAQIAEIRGATKAPFNVNFFTHTTPEPDPARENAWVERLSTYYSEFGLDPADAAKGPGRAPFDEATCKVIEETRPAVVSFHFGLPEESLLARVKATGAQVWSSATTVEEARWLAARGVDAIIAQGREAGGHRGMFLTDDIDAQPGLIALLPQVIDAVNVPVIAAGGIADARGVAAALMLGAAAAQIGTAYLLSPQAATSAVHRAGLKAGRDDTTRLTNLFTGRPARGHLNRYMREQGPINAAAPAFPLATGAITPLRAHAEKQGSGDFSPLWSGEAAPLAREEDAGAFTQRVWAEAQARVAEVARRAGG